MAKKIAQQALTPAEEARQKAATVVEIEDKIKLLKEQADTLKEELKAYVADTDDTDLGVLIAQKRLAKPAIDFTGFTPKEKSYIVEGLMKDLPDFVETSTDLNIEKMFFALGTNPHVGNALKVRGVAIVKKETMAFVKPK